MMSSTRRIISAASEADTRTWGKKRNNKFVNNRPFPFLIKRAKKSAAMFVRFFYQLTWRLTEKDSVMPSSAISPTIPLVISGKRKGTK